VLPNISQSYPSVPLFVTPLGFIQTSLMQAMHCLQVIFTLDDGWFFGKHIGSEKGNEAVPKGAALFYT